MALKVAIAPEVVSMRSEHILSWLIREPFWPFPPHRFNCGTGIAVITSESKIKLGAWHTVTLHRDGLKGLLQVNNGTLVTGQSQVSMSLTPCPPNYRPLLTSPRVGWGSLQRAEADMAGRTLRAPIHPTTAEEKS